MSVNYDLIRELKDWVKRYVREKIAAGLVKYGAYSRSTADGEHDKISGYQTEGPDEEKYDFEGRRVFPFGIRSRPPSGTYGVWVGKGGESGDGVIVGAESSRFGPNDLNDGEVAIYNKVTGCVILLKDDGTMQINGSGYSLLKTEDFLADLAKCVAAILGANYTSGALVATNPTDITNFIANLTGVPSPNPPTESYKSTKVKNG